MVSESEKELVSALQQIMQMYGIDLDEQMIVTGETGDEFVDYAEVLSKTQEKIDELSQQAEEIYKKTGMTREELLAYADNPQNFSKAEWDSLEQVKEACEAMKKETAQLLKPQEALLNQKPKKGKSQRSRFVKKRNWLSS